MRFLVSGGPTHEYLDDVRYLGNPSTGAMGIAVAEAAVAGGHEATLVCWGVGVVVGCPFFGAPAVAERKFVLPTPT